MIRVLQSNKSFCLLCEKDGIVSSRADFYRNLPDHNDFVSVGNYEEVDNFCENMMNGSLLRGPSYTFCISTVQECLQDIVNRLSKSISENDTASNKMSLHVESSKDLVEILEHYIRVYTVSGTLVPVLIYCTLMYSTGTLGLYINATDISSGISKNKRLVHLNGAREFFTSNNIEVGKGTIKQQVSGISKATFGGLDTIGYGNIKDFRTDIICDRSSFIINANALGKSVEEESGDIITGIINISIDFKPINDSGDIFDGVDSVNTFTNLIKMSQSPKNHSWDTLVENKLEAFKLSKITVRCSNNYIKTQQVKPKLILEQLVKFWTDMELHLAGEQMENNEVSYEFEDEYRLSIINLL